MRSSIFVSIALVFSTSVATLTERSRNAALSVFATIPDTLNLENLALRRNGDIIVYSASGWFNWLMFCCYCRHPWRIRPARHCKARKRCILRCWRKRHGINSYCHRYQRSMEGWLARTQDQKGQHPLEACQGISCDRNSVGWPFEWHDRRQFSSTVIRLSLGPDTFVKRQYQGIQNNHQRRNNSRSPREARGGEWPMHLWFLIK